MTDEQLSQKISQSATKLVVRKYPFIMSGDFQGIFEPTYSYRKFQHVENNKITGIRTILWVNPEIFFELYDVNSYLYDSIMNGRVEFTNKYLSSIYDRDSPLYTEVTQTDEDILKIFYETGNIMNGNEKLGILDFFIRYAFMGNGVGSWSGFLDSDVAIPPPGIIR